MAESSGETKFTLKLVVDEEKKKVVFAEACRDFVDVLFSLLTLPMGTIVRLLEKHRKSEPVPVGCFNNLYKSVVDMGTGDFETEACKEMLLYPRSLRDVQCESLKLNLHSTEGNKWFFCSASLSCKMCSDFSTSRCRCGKLMNITAPKEKVVENIQDGVFVRGGSSYIITDDLKVAVRSTGLVLRKLKSLGCGDFPNVVERLVDIGFDEVMTLLQCIFSSNAPLTDTFLNKQSSPQRVLKTFGTPSRYTERKMDESEAGTEEKITLSAIVRKRDMRVLYVECGEDFVDLLLTFLAVPLGSVLGISGDSSTFRCIGNLFKSFKDLSASEVSASKAVLPHYYRCQKQLLNIITEKPPSLVKSSDKEPLVVIDPKSPGPDQLTSAVGFVKRNAMFTVSDDLIITPMNSSSAFCILNKFQSKAEDLQVQEISISKTQATSLLRASLVTSSALNGVLWNSTLKKNPMKRLEETHCLSFVTSVMFPALFSLRS